MNKQLSVIVESVKNAKVEMASYAEEAIDLAVDNELWENVPIVEHANRILNIRDIYKKNKLKRNCAAFIEAVSELNEDEVAAYQGILFSGDQLAEETAETIFDIVSESEKPIKAEIIGRLSLALAKYQVSLEEYYTISLIIQSASVAALKALPAFLDSNGNICHKSSPGGIPEEGLLLSLGVAMRHGNMFRIDETGQRLARFGFGIDVNV